jgi:hypothetical protein
MGYLPGFELRAVADLRRAKHRATARRYPISNDDLRYVLAAFVVVPLRWLRDYGWRELTDVELRASVAYYRRQGTLMGIHDIPADLARFERLLDDYEAARFQRDDSSRLIADATLDLMATFPAQKMSYRPGYNVAALGTFPPRVEQIDDIRIGSRPRGQT